MHFSLCCENVLPRSFFFSFFFFLYFFFIFFFFVFVGGGWGGGGWEGGLTKEARVLHDEIRPFALLY